MLDTESIRRPIADLSGSRLELLEVFAEIESTSSYLIDQPCPSPGAFRVALADHQTAGRGRMQRTWHSPPATGLCMSLSFTFRRPAGELSGLTLALGTGVARALEDLEIRGIGLKWPNDIIARDCKLGGILTELKDNDEGTTIVTGIGLNVDLRNAEEFSTEPNSIGRIIDLASCTGAVPTRESLAVAVIGRLLTTMQRFEAHGFAPFVDDWRTYDWLRGQVIAIDTGQETVTGRVEGIDADGLLLMRTDEGRRGFLSGSVIMPDRDGPAT